MTFETASTDYANADSLEITEILPLGEDCNIAYYIGSANATGGFIYLQYPGSDVRAISYLDAV